MAIIASSTVEYPTGGESRYFDLTLPAGTVPGDVFVFNPTTNVDLVTAITPPSEAVELMGQGGAASAGVSGSVWWYEVPPGGGAGDLVRFDWGSGVTRRGTLAWSHFRGTDLTAHRWLSTAWESSAISSHSIPEVTTTEADCTILTGIMFGSGSDTPTLPSGFTRRTDATQREGSMASRELATPGGSGSGSWITSGGYRSRRWTLAVSEGGAPEPVVADVVATAQTDYMPAGYSGDIADTPAVWVNPDNADASVILGSRKAVSGGGVDVYGLDGARLSFWAAGEVNNVAVRDLRGVGAWGDRVMVVGTNRTNNTLTFGWLDRSTRSVSAAGAVSVGFEPYGCCLYLSPVNGDLYAFVSEATGGAGGLKQYRLGLTGSTVTGTQVRSMPTATLSEGMACHDAESWLFLGEEDSGLYRYNAEPDGGTSRVTIDTVGAGHLVADVEGIAIAYGRDPADPDYLIVSSQGDNTFQVYDLEDPHAWVKAFRVLGDEGLIGPTTETDGIAVTRADLSPWWPAGVFVAHDTTNDDMGQPASNFKLVDAGRIFPELPYRPAPVALTGTSTASLASPAGRWTKAPMCPLWYDVTAAEWRAIVPTPTGHRLFHLDDEAPGGGTLGAVVDARQEARVTVVHHAGLTYTLAVAAGVNGGVCRIYDSEWTQQGASSFITPSTPFDLDASPVALLRTTNGHLWAAWKHPTASTVQVRRSTDGGASWSTGSVSTTGMSVTGMAALVQAGSRLVLVATGNDGTGRVFRSIDIDTATITSSSWSTEAAPSLPSGVTSDDHLSMVPLPDGRVLAVSKTTGATTGALPLLYSLIRDAGGGWTSQVVEYGPDETPPSFTRPRVTVMPSGEVVAMYGSVYGAQDLSVRTTTLDTLGTWGGRSSAVLGPDWSDSAVLPLPEALAASAGQPWPVLAHNRATGVIEAVWMGQATGGLSYEWFLGDVPLELFLGDVPLGEMFLGDAPM